MRITIPLAVAFLATALAGCSDDPATGTFSFEGSAATIDGEVDATLQDFEPAYSETDGHEVEQCPTEDVPDPLPAEKCTWAKTVIDVNFSDLVDPQSETFNVFFVDSTGAVPDEDTGEDLTGVHEMGGVWMGEFHFDNSGDCEGRQGDQASQDCNKKNKFDTLEVRLGDIPYAAADLADGAAFAPLDIHTAVRFDGSYSGKDFDVSVSGLDSNLTYTAWLITEEEGAAVHAESFSVTNGQNTYTAQKAGDKYVALHIHVSGTKINVAVGSIS